MCGSQCTVLLLIFEFDTLALTGMHNLIQMAGQNYVFTHSKSVFFMKEARWGHLITKFGSPRLDNTFRGTFVLQACSGTGQKNHSYCFQNRMWLFEMTGNALAFPEMIAELLNIKRFTQVCEFR